LLVFLAIMFHHIAMTWDKAFLHDDKSKEATFGRLCVLEFIVVFMVDAASVVVTAVEMGKKVLMWRCCLGGAFC